MSNNTSIEDRFYIFGPNWVFMKVGQAIVTSRCRQPNMGITHKDGLFGENCDILDVSGQLKTRLLS